MKYFHTRRAVILLSISFLLFFNSRLKAQVETISTGSFIINMGATNPQTIANGLKPYGLIYDLIRNYAVPIKCVIGQTKVKDGVDFSYNGTQFRGGTYIIPAEFRSVAVNNRITYWIGQGVVGVTTASDLILDVTYTVTSIPKWTLDDQNGDKAEEYLINAGITNSAFPGAYNWKNPQILACCDDFFVMPHADPKWSTHSNLLSWNLTCYGSIWAACHAVSALENMVNPANRNQQTNFLTVKDPAFTGVSGDYANSNSLLLWGDHNDGTPPFIHRLPSLPVSQYMGITDEAMDNGSEQIYIPRQGALSRWNPNITIISYDPSHPEVPVLNPDLRNAAVMMAYGHGFDDPDRGYVMYEAGHSHNKGTVDDVAAQRAFFNFSFYQVIYKVPQLSISGITNGQQIQWSTTITGLQVIATSNLAGITFSYQWTSSCGGSFSNPTGATTNYTAPNPANSTPCVITCTVTDNCGRVSFRSFAVDILANHVPTANNDAQSFDPGCNVVSHTYNVLTNDNDQDGQPITMTNVTGALNGITNFTADGDITYTPNAGFFGIETLTYTVCDNTTPAPLCSNGTYTLTVGNLVNIPNASNDAVNIAEDVASININVLANDVPVVSGPLNVSAITSPAANGKVSINADNTIDYIPNPDFAGTDNFTYRIVNSLGYSKSAIVTVTITNDSCNSGTYESAPPVPGVYSQNPVADSYIEEGGNDTRNYGAETQIWVDREGGKMDRTLLRWDVSSIPANATVTSATLTLVLDANASGSNIPTSIHQVTNNWVEGTGLNTNDMTVNWINRSGITPTYTAWTTAGGDYNATAINTQTLLSAWNAGQSVSWTVTSLVQGWVNGTMTNYGALIRAVTESGGDNDFRFGSREHGTAGRRPVLSVNYTTPVCSAIPSRAPLGNQDTTTTISVTPVIFNALTNDNLFSQPATALTISTAPNPAQGSASANLGAGTVTFTPNPAFNGVATFQYTVSTANGSDVVRVYVRVENSPVVATDDNPAAQLSDLDQTVTVLANDTDPESGVLNVSIVTLPLNGIVTVNGSNQIVYTPNSGFTGTDEVTYQVCEPYPPACGFSYCDTAKVYFIVNNRTPVSFDDAGGGAPCQALHIPLITNDIDPEGNALTVTNISALSNPLAGTLVDNMDGSVTFNAAMGFLGVVTFTYTVTDNGIASQTSAPSTVTITISASPNGSPIAANDTGDPMEANTVGYFSVLDNDSDPDDNTLTMPVITVQPANGTATVLPNGLIQYTPNWNWFGTDQLTYQICDEPADFNCNPLSQLCDVAILTITVNILATLPVTGLHLSARLNDDNVSLTWKTQSEFNSDYFMIQRSTDNREYIDLGRRTAAGNSTSVQYYQFTDNISNVNAGVIYYRIKQLDIDDKAGYSNVVIVKPKQVIGIDAWPSPFRENININIYATQPSFLNIKLVSLSGQAIHFSTEAISKGTNQIPIIGLDRLSSGIYILYVEDKNGQVLLRQKFLK